MVAASQPPRDRPMTLASRIPRSSKAWRYQLAMSRMVIIQSSRVDLPYPGWEGTETSKCSDRAC